MEQFKSILDQIEKNIKEQNKEILALIAKAVKVSGFQYTKHASTKNAVLKSRITATLCQPDHWRKNDKHKFELSKKFGNQWLKVVAVLQRTGIVNLITVYYAREHQIK
jgi:hypothetical protein